MELAGKVAVLTGASRGIGRALSVALAGQGCSLLLSALEADELSAFAEEVRAAHPVEVAAMSADLTDAASRRGLIEWVRTQPRPPDILVNNAGAGAFGRFDAASWPDVEKQIVLNVHASTHITLELIPILRGRPEARIVNISSGVARLPYPGLAVYGAAKGFVSSLSESLACELAGTRVSVLCFHPGFTQTAFMTTARMDMGRIPNALLLSPERVAARIVKAIRRDRRWVYGDVATRTTVFLSHFLTPRMRTAIFRRVYWRLPDEA